ncbi:MAG: TlpA family protein disulfide reductase [Planctomycetes bacterium]|nr:TlpA family protein disulfide reductase [Planctomycetota bacterium]
MTTFALTVAALLAASGDTVVLKPVNSGAGAKIGSYMPQRLTLSATKPAAITKAPEGLTDAMYGELAFAGKKVAIIVNEPAGKPATLYIDSNGNNDLTDDGAQKWEGKTNKSGDKETTMYSGGGNVMLGTTPVNINMYRFDKNDPTRAQLKDVLLYYRDYALEGEVTVGGKSMKAMLADDMTTGDYRGKAIETKDGKESASGVNLMIDVNGNGKFDRKGESFDVRKPFNIGGTTYEVKELDAAGASFQIAKSDKKVDEIPTPPDLSKGANIIAFEATSMTGKKINFPGDYKGKVVLLDFWATWCGPCVKEIPHVVEAHKTYGSQGFEVLGISLDQKDKAEHVTKFTADKGMAWEQVYDGGFWKAAIAQKYAIDSIPAVFLVDGDTGKILATASDLRGDKLAKSVEAALAAKKK